MWICAINTHIYLNNCDFVKILNNSPLLGKESTQQQISVGVNSVQISKKDKNIKLFNKKKKN